MLCGPDVKPLLLYLPLHILSTGLLANLFQFSCSERAMVVASFLSLETIFGYELASSKRVTSDVNRANNKSEKTLGYL